MIPIISKITDEWIDDNHPCQAALKWWKKSEREPMTILDKLISAEKYEWASWFIVRIMEKDDYVSYAIYAAEQVLNLYEIKYPGDIRPRNAIESAKKYLSNKDYATAAHAAAIAADDAAAAAAADAAADAAAYAAAAAAAAAAAIAAAAAAAAAADAAAADDADAAAAYAAIAAADAADAADAARKEMQIKILNYGIALLKLQQS